MNSLILRVAARLLVFWMLLFSWWLLFRGHQSPGGGFIGGLFASASFALYLLAYGRMYLLALIVFNPIHWLILGFSLTILSGLWGMVSKQTFLSGVWPGSFAFLMNSPLLFDLGIYLVTCFSVLSMLLALEEAS